MNKSLINIGHLSLLVTTILAIMFYKERVIWVDPGQQVFEMINEGGYKIFVGRYSMAINQTIPLIAIKLGMPLKHILLAYSLSFVFIYYICFIISVYWFKNIPAGLCIAFVPLIIRQAFGHSISEAWLGIAYSGVFYALLNYYHQWKAKGIKFILLFYFLSFLIIAINYFIHPITMLTIGFAIGFTFLNKKEFRSVHIYIVTFIVLFIYLLKFIFPANHHEENFFAGLKMADQLIPQLFNLPIIKFIAFAFFKIYLFILIPFFISAILYIKKKRIMLLLFVAGYALFEVLVASLAFYKGDAHFALESRLIPLVMIIMIPFIELLQTMRKNYLVIIGMLAGLTISHVILISEVRKVHTRRINHYENLLSEVGHYPERKFYMNESTKRHSAINSWGPAVETLLLSSLNGKENSRTIFVVKKDMNVTVGLHYWPCVFLWAPWWIFANEDMLNKKYFDLGCTSYREIENPENK